MKITLKQFKKFADDNDIMWFYNKLKWMRGNWYEAQFGTPKEREEERRILQNKKIVDKRLDGDWNEAHPRVTGKWPIVYPDGEMYNTDAKELIDENINKQKREESESPLVNELTANKDMIIANLVQRQINLNNKQKREETMKSNIGIARVCHEANRQYCIDNKLPVGPVWDKTPENIKNSVIAGVAQVIANPKVTATEMHEKWCDYKDSQGWKLGELDIKKKLHPNLIPFNKLPKAERGKDMLFIKTVRAELKK